jgi:curved DNA-binding protein CbpA
LDDLYSILGVAPDASANEIRGRYRFLAQAFHPDKFSSVEQKQQVEEEFKIINNAYQILSVPQKREMYDRKRNPSRVYSRKTEDNRIRQAEKTTQQKKEEAAARQRAQEEIAKQEEQRKRSRKWIEANQTSQKGARLRGVDLRNGYLEDANFEDADLREANLNGSRLYFAKLVRADLTNSKLIYAWLSSPNYRG